MKSGSMKSGAMKSGAMKSAAMMLAAMMLAASLVGCGSSGSTGSGPKAASSPKEAANSADFGTMKNVCHKATGKNTAGKELGVTPDSIKVTTISDAGSDLQKGLNQELWDAATVFTRWCNDHGGINGRKISFIEGDAQVVRYKDVIDQACTSSFALVGGGGAFDNTGQEARLKCGLVAVPGFVASAEARGAALSYPAMATGIGKITGGGLRYLAAKAGGPVPVASVYGDFDTTRFTIDLRMAAAESSGAATRESPVNQAKGTDKELFTYNVLAQKDWRPVAQAIKDSGAKGLLFSGQPADLGRLVNALTAINAQKEAGGALEWVFTDENMYDQVLIKNARSGLTQGLPVYVQTFFYPFEEANRGEKSIAMDNLQLLFQHYLPNGKSKAMFAVSGFASWLLFAQAAGACGDTLTRKCLVDEIEKVKTFDAGGLVAARNPAKPTESSQCFALLQATPGGFVRVKEPDTAKFPMLQPTQGTGRGVFNCDATNIENVGTDPIMAEWIDKANLFAKPRN